MNSRAKVNHWVQTYGDMVYDLCVSLLHQPPHAQLVFRSVVKKIYFRSYFEKYSTYERGWILRLTCERLLQAYHHHRDPSVDEQSQLDTQPEAANRLNHFSLYFYRLKPEDQLLLLLRDKWNLGFDDISMALGIPEGSLQVKRDQALRSLEKWIFDESPQPGKILEAINNLPQYPLPPSLKEAPLSLKLPRPETFRLSLLRLDRIPWYLRLLIESAGMIVIILTAISFAPKIRNFYEKKMEENLSDFKDDWKDDWELAKEDSGENPEEALDSTQKAGVAATSEDLHSQDEVAGEDESHGESEGGKQNAPDKSYLWRFTLKTVSPDELRPQVARVLKDLNIPVKAAQSYGVQVPGGIEFDVMVPSETVAELQKALEKLVPPSINVASHDSSALGSEVAHADAPPLSETTQGISGKPFGGDQFTWYRVKSKKPIPAGKSKVVIWLAQPTH